MACIEARTSQTGKTSYRAMVRLKGIRPISATFDTRSAAKNWAVRTEHEIKDGRYFKNNKAQLHTCGEMIQKYIREVLPLKKNHKTQKSQLLAWEKLIGSLTLQECTTSKLAQARDALALKNPKQLKNSTINQYLVSMHTVFQTAIDEWQWLETTNPMRLVKKLPKAPDRVRYLSDDERIGLLKACEESRNAHLKNLITLWISTGLRKNELLKMKWSQIDWNREIAIITDTKTNVPRSVQLVGVTLKILKSMVTPDSTGYIFASERNPNKPMNVETAFRFALKRAGVSDFHIHDCRHTHCSYLLMNGANTLEIASSTSHRSISMVQRYSHLSQEHTRGVVGSMIQKIFPEN